MEQTHTPSEQDHQAPQEKLEYHAPEVREYGTVADLTRTSPTTAPLTVPDGGTAFPNLYLTGEA